jgi:ElaB/YqjD/DUF883 family membrane-anchored ribosome-binding protein
MTDTTSLSSSHIDALAERAAGRADDAIAATRRAANGALDALHHGIDDLRDQTPGAISRAAAQVEDLTRRGLDRAKQTSADVRHPVSRASDRTVGYIQDEPVKSVLIALAAGAAAAALIGLLTRSRSTER